LSLLSQVIGAHLYFFALFQGISVSEGAFEILITVVGFLILGIPFWIFNKHRRSIPFWSLCVTFAVYDCLRFVHPPLPGSLIWMYMGATILAILIFASIRDVSLKETQEAFIHIVTDQKLSLVRRSLFILVSSYAGLVAYSVALPRISPPIEIRSIHPAPPAEINFKGKKIILAGLENPLRAAKEEAPQEFEKYVMEGKKIYYQNCFFCHGDALQGRGPFAESFQPRPLPFNKDTIAQLQESFVFWRVAKGGPALPRESTPWSSAMPKWEDFLTEEEIWKVILFLYEHTGIAPRTWEGVHPEDEH